MRFLLSLTFCFFLSLSSFAKTKKLCTTLYFETASAQLNGKEFSKLKTLVSSFSPKSDYEIYIYGHTDAMGAEDYNIQLAHQRAEAVKKQLAQIGVKPILLISQAYGETKPIKSNSREAWRKVNRRVEVEVRLYTFESVAELQDVLKQPSFNHFVINPEKAQKITGKKGVSISIPAHAFKDADGNPIKEKVHLTLTEALHYDEFIAHELVTISDDRLLVSAGMAKLEAKTESGEVVKLKAGENLEMNIPALERDDRMQVFNSATGNNWELSNSTMDLSFIYTYDVRLRSQYVLEKLPEYMPDLSSKPEKPKRIGKPIAPRLPDETRLKPPLKWYEKPFASVVKKKQNRAYIDAMKRYQKAQQLYQRRYDIYVEHNAEMPIKLRKYELALQAWKKKRYTDSVAFTNSETHLNFEAKNNQQRRLAQEERRRAYKKAKAEKQVKLAALADSLDEVSASSEGFVDAYVANMSELSWINIDRFYKMPMVATQTIKLKNQQEDQIKAQVVFKNMNSLLPLTRKENGDWVSEPVPKKERKALLAYKVVEGKTMVYFEDIRPGKTEYRPKYKPYSFSELKELLQNIQS